MRPGIVRYLHDHERAAVAKTAGWDDPAKAAGHGVYGWVYEDERWAGHYTGINQAAGHQVTGPVEWEGQWVALLVPVIPPPQGGLSGPEVGRFIRQWRDLGTVAAGEARAAMMAGRTWEGKLAGERSRQLLACAQALEDAARG